MKTTCISNFNSFPTCTSSGLPWCPVAGEVEPSLSTRFVPHPKYSLGGKKTEHPRISWNFHLPFLHQETCLNSANLGRCYISPSPALSTCNCRAKATPAKALLPLGSNLSAWWKAWLWGKGCPNGFSDDFWLRLEAPDIPRLLLLHSSTPISCKD